ncbi:hypothetical protein T01_8533 [Trichinella spiralis]|uniref:Uncharacterized protein n=1 Tax=Trichinella spiralis TaxID=6334 RepID=A0A0V1BXY1_TRISP|nr:hypothetical protein T01_8533 [Trichinella spiralis]
MELVTQLQNRASDLLKNSDYQPDLPHTGATPRQGECVPLSKFEGAVHRRKNCDNITKFVRLRSCLSGVAPQLINGLTITAENCESVIRLLHDQFHRTTDILDANIMRLLGIQQATSHNRKELLRRRPEPGGTRLSLLLRLSSVLIMQELLAEKRLKLLQIHSPLEDIAIFGCRHLCAICV